MAAPSYPLYWVAAILVAIAIYVYLRQKRTREGLGASASDSFVGAWAAGAYEMPEEEKETGPVMKMPAPGPHTLKIGTEMTGSEGFTDYDTPCPTDVKTTYPTARNPFMNVLNNEWPRNVYSDMLADDAKYDPLRPMANSIDDPLVKQGLDDFFRTNFYNDPTDVFGKSQDQRQFITMPSTTIPNDRESYQNWLYKMEPQPCKSGGRTACYPGTDGGPIVSLNQYY